MKNIEGHFFWGGCIKVGEVLNLADLLGFSSFPTPQYKSTFVKKTEAMPETDAIKRFIESELRELAEKFVRERVAALQNRKIAASGELQKSLQYEINAQAKAEAVEMLLAFEEHGRFIDMKRLKAPENFGNPYVNILEEWIRKRGWEQKFIQKFMSKRKLRKIPENVLNQIAWGIAINRSKGKFRRKKWYNSPKTAFVSEVFNQVVAGLPEITQEIISKGFQNTP